jgi:GT2 family glycosyltransferase
MPAPRANLSVTSAIDAARAFWPQAAERFSPWLFGQEGRQAENFALTAGRLAGDAPAFLPAAQDLPRWLWQSRPLDAVRRDILLGAAPPRGAAGELLAGLDAAGNAPADASGWEALAPDSGPDEALAALIPRVRDARHGLAWLAAAWDALLARGAADHALLLGKHYPWPELPRGEALFRRLLAEWAVACRPPDEAEGFLDALDPELWDLWLPQTRHILALARNETDVAARHLAGLWTAMPWHANLTLALHGLLRPMAPAPAASSDHAVAVCIYTWNKAEDLARTLASLEASRLGRAFICVLDNGSDDATPEVLAACGSRLGKRLEVVTLPVNVGAPAARNWLLSLPRVREAEFVAFLDDDLDLPPDWLDELLGAALAHPDAGVVGCRVLDHEPPFAVQSADYHFLPPYMISRSFDDLPERLSVCNYGGVPDCGLFAYTRPCASVTGCCHLFRRAELNARGGFDVRFTPTQFDDLERDLRAFSAGGHALYHGRLAVRHRQASGLRRPASALQTAQVMGNKIKLEYLYAETEPEKLLTAQRDLLLADLLTRVDDLAADLPNL